MTELEAVQSDAQAPPDGVMVPLVTANADVSVLVPPPGRWRTRANRALRVGDFDEWAELVLSGQDYAAWVEADPTNDDVETFFRAWKDASGEDKGKSSASQRSSRSTARR